MDIGEVKRHLESQGFKVSESERLGNDTGWKLKLASGQQVNVFDKGTWNVQGKNPEKVRPLLEQHWPMVSDGRSAKVSRNVFVVYGHDDNARNELEAMLRRWDLNPLLLDQLPSEGQTLIEKLEKYQSDVQFGVVLATPDDEGHRAGHLDEKTYRVRQNVVLELGMLLTLLGRKRVAILLKDQVKTERPSDIQGLIYIPFKDSIKEAALSLAKEMASQGLSIDLKKV
jgi:predicted nucleotide-binding protein